MDRFHQYLPSKKFIQTTLSVAIALILIGFVYFWPAGKTENALEPQKAREEAVQLIAANLEKDSDGDKLKDWEETLWKTNSYNKDTDGDGTDDGTEVEKGRNPAISGPNDKVEVKPIETTTSGETTGELSNTDRLAQDIFAQYLIKKQQGVDITPADRQQIINTAITRSGSVLDSPRYIISDVKTVGDSIEAYRTYGNALGKIIAENVVSSENEAIIMKRSLEEANPEELKKLDPIIASYNKILNTSLSTPAPKTIAGVHLRFINSIHTVITGTTAMRNVYEDPVSALQAISVYQTTQDGLTSVLREIKAFFTLQNISFSNSEYGSLLTGKVK